MRCVCEGLEAREGNHFWKPWTGDLRSKSNTKKNAFYSSSYIIIIFAIWWSRLCWGLLGLPNVLSIIQPNMNLVNVPIYVLIHIFGAILFYLKFKIISYSQIFKNNHKNYYLRDILLYYKLPKGLEPINWRHRHLLVGRYNIWS